MALEIAMQALTAIQQAKAWYDVVQDNQVEAKRLLERFVALEPA